MAVWHGNDGMPFNQKEFDDHEEAAREQERRDEQERLVNKHPVRRDTDRDKDTKTINYLGVPKDVWHWIKNTANAEGVRFDRFVVYLLEDQKQNWKRPTETSSAEEVMPLLLAKSDTISDLYDMARRMAVNYNKNPTDEHRQLVIDACAKVGLLPEDILNDVMEDAFSQVAEQYTSDTDSKMNRCIKWLIELCKDRDEIKSSDVNRLGEGVGYTKQMIYSARRRAGIGSTIKAGEWYLVVPKSTRVLHGTVGE